MASGGGAAEKLAIGDLMSWQGGLGAQAPRRFFYVGSFLQMCRKSVGKPPIHTF